METSGWANSFSGATFVKVFKAHQELQSTINFLGVKGKKENATATKPTTTTAAKKRTVFHVFTFETIANRTQRLRIQNTRPNILKIRLGKVAEGRAGNSAGGGEAEQ